MPAVGEQREMLGPTVLLPRAELLGDGLLTLRMHLVAAGARSRMRTRKRITENAKAPCDQLREIGRKPGCGTAVIASY